MALVKGVNVGFVTTAPTADPAGTGGTTNLSNWRQAILDTSPSGTTKVTEIGFWANDSSISNVEYYVGIYEDTGSGFPGDRVAFVTGNFTGTTVPEWKVASGLDIPISANTNYWIAVSTLTGVITDFENIGGTGRSREFGGAPNLPDPYDSTDTDTIYLSFYAVVEISEPTGTNMQINIGDSFKSVDALKINIGDVWKSVTSVKLNIGDVWKDVF